MATYSTSERLIKEYKLCRGSYVCSGAICKIPTRLKVVSFFPKNIPWKMYVLLIAVK